MRKIRTEGRFYLGFKGGFGIWEPEENGGTWGRCGRRGRVRNKCGRNIRMKPQGCNLRPSSSRPG